MPLEQGRLNELLTELWKAAQNHCIVHLGEWLNPDEIYEGDNVPDMPDESTVLQMVTDYLKETS